MVQIEEACPVLNPRGSGGAGARFGGRDGDSWVLRPDGSTVAWIAAAGEVLMSSDGSCV